MGEERRSKIRKEEAEEEVFVGAAQSCSASTCQETRVWRVQAVLVQILGCGRKNRFREIFFAAWQMDWWWSFRDAISLSWTPVQALVWAFEAWYVVVVMMS